MKNDKINDKFTVGIVVPPQFVQLEGYNLSLSEKYSFFSMPAYGAGVITAALKNKGYSVLSQDLNVLHGMPKIFSTLNLFKYWHLVGAILTTGRSENIVDEAAREMFNLCKFDKCNVVGFSISAFGHFLFAVLLARMLRDISKVPIIFGGTFITIYGHLYPEILDFVDYMVVGDASEPLLELLDYLQDGRNDKKAIKEIPNIIYKEDSEGMRVNKFNHYPIENMLMPDFDELDLALYRNPLNGELILPYQVSRACKFNCSFCVQNPVDIKYQAKTYLKVGQEIKELIKRYGCNSFHFCDSNIGSDSDYFNGLLEYFLEKNIKFKWRSYMGVCGVNKDILNKMKLTGCDALLFGIESGSERSLRMINKPHTVKLAAEVLKLTKGCGIDTLTTFITGYPYEVQKDVTDSMRFFHNNQKYIDSIVIRKFMVVYGSRIFHNPKKYDLSIVPMVSRCMYAFNELKGLNWEQKTRQQEQSKQKLMQYLEKTGLYNRVD
jgi:radical SAM superfamily enzyme YgiQ (UPF0313 family)